jgi:uncharacterized protein (DUF2267 family)
MRTERDTLRDTNLFASTVADAHRWIDEVCGELDWLDRRDGLHALRAALHVLRDRLSVEQNAHLSAQLPTLIRGLYFEGWRPGGGQHVERTLERYTQELEDALDGRSIDVEPVDVARAVHAVLARHVSGGEVRKIVATLPHQLRVLWEGD